MPEHNPANNDSDGWVGQAEDVIELGERVGVWTRPGTTPSGGTMSPAEQRAFLEARGLGALYEEGGPFYDAAQEQINGMGGLLPKGNGTGEGVDGTVLAGMVVGGVLLTGGLGFAMLMMLYFAKNRMG